MHPDTRLNSVGLDGDALRSDGIVQVQTDTLTEGNTNSWAYSKHREPPFDGKAVCAETVPVLGMLFLHLEKQLRQRKKKLLPRISILGWGAAGCGEAPQWRAPHPSLA
mmetsp:Transcript_132612/g.258312  ORF Transcript_132612/g.258312 Transcript_132612/m.258312 type:complete len:108 (-) Transcript_132612:4-327(-)